MLGCRDMSSDLDLDLDFDAELVKRGGAFKYGLVIPFLRKFPFEDQEHVPNFYYYDSDDDDDCNDFYRNLKFRHPNAHDLVKRFLQQVRDSNGYDVDCCPPPMFGSPFIPRNPNTENQSYRNVMMRATQVAIEKINAATGKTYVLVEVVRAVDTICTLYFLTFTVKEAYSGVDAPVETIRALVKVPYSGSLDYELDEWMIKQAPPTTENSQENMNREKKAKIGEGINDLVWLTSLEDEILVRIFSYLDEESAINLAWTCKSMWFLWSSLKKNPDSVCSFC